VSYAIDPSSGAVTQAGSLTLSGNQPLMVEIVPAVP
jgi:hypothetical protein